MSPPASAPASISRDEATGKAVEALELAELHSSTSGSGCRGGPLCPSPYPTHWGDLLPQEQLLSPCPAWHGCVTPSRAEGTVLQELPLSWVSPQGHRASLLRRIGARGGCEVAGAGAGSWWWWELCCVHDCRCPLSPLPWGPCSLEVLGGWMLGWRGALGMWLP